MAQRADDIRHDIEDTRAAMTVKLAILEERVLETVAGAQTSVEKIMEDVGVIVTDVRATVDTTLATVDTTLVAVRQSIAGTQASVGEIVEHMKGTIGNTVATVQRTFDLPAQVEHHPWPMVGGALLAGYIARELGWWPPVCGWLPKGPPQASRLPDLEAFPQRARRPLVHSRSRG